MTQDKTIDAFLSQYDEVVFTNALRLREVILKNTPDVIEEIDLPAKIIGYSYGRRYVDVICTMIPSKKGLKLGFYRGMDLPDPTHLLEGTGKISRYVDIKSSKQIQSPALRKLIQSAINAYKQRTSSSSIGRKS